MKNLIGFCFIFLVACANNDTLSDGKFYTWVDEFGVAHVLSKESDVESSLKIEEKLDAVGSDLSVERVNVKDYISSDVIDAKLNKEKHFSWVENGKVVEEVVDVGLLKQESGEFAFNKMPPVSLTTQTWIENLEFNKVLSFADAANRELNLSQLYTYDPVSKIDYLIIEMPSNFNFKSLIVKSLMKSHSIALPSVKFFTAGLIQVPLPFVFDEEHQETWSSYAYLTGSAQLSSEIAYIVIHTNQQSIPVIESFNNALVSNLGFVVLQAI